MSTTNLAVNQQPITPGEIAYFLKEVLEKTSEQFAPGKLAINSDNSDLLQRFVREHEPTVVTVVRTLLETRQYIQAVKTLTSAYVKATKQIMFDPASKLEWTTPHPAVLKRRELEAQQSGMKPTQSNGDAEVALAAKVRQAEVDTETAKQEAKYEKAVLDLIDRVFFANARTQTRDARKIEELQASLRDDVAKARKNGHSWVKIHAHILGKIDEAYKKDERERERWNSR